MAKVFLAYTIRPEINGERLSFGPGVVDLPDEYAYLGVPAEQAPPPSPPDPDPPVIEDPLVVDLERSIEAIKYDIGEVADPKQRQLMILAYLEAEQAKGEEARSTLVRWLETELAA